MATAATTPPEGGADHRFTFVRIVGLVAFASRRIASL
jgi:hypothetical protein